MSGPLGHPILSCDEARVLEERLFAGDEAREWQAMRRAGLAVAAAAALDFEEIGGFPAEGRILVLAGKGHNAGDALIAAGAVLDRFPKARAEIVFPLGERDLRPLAQRAWRELSQRARAVAAPLDAISGGYALCLDGVFGFAFRPPLPPEAAAAIGKANDLPIQLRAAVDLPSGVGSGGTAAGAFRADFTYATGSVKLPLIDSSNAANVGRLRYLNLGFFEESPPESRLRILTSAVLDPLRAIRDPKRDKRDYGHLFAIGGSRSFPGAILMTVEAALRSGVGLVTAFVPESLAPAFAASAPEAMWVGWPETQDGGLAPEGRHLLEERLERASAIAFGPGFGRAPGTLALGADIARISPVPMVIDADALQPEIVGSGAAPRILTPHLGEFRRISEGEGFHGTAPTRDAVVLLKGRLTGITRGDKGWFSAFGGPVLSRGGSGDLLTGIIGGLLAQEPSDPVLAACRGAVWHGLAADLLARSRGQVAVHTTQLLDFMPDVLRGDV